MVALVFVRYRGHVLFRNCSSETVKPIEREASAMIIPLQLSHPHPEIHAVSVPEEADSDG